MKSSVDIELDVLAIGGGPAGAATALQLSRQGLSVGIVERSTFSQRRIGEMLAPENRPILETLGIWNAFLESAPLASPGLISAWESAEPLERDFVFNPYGVGWHLDRSRFDQFLVQQAAAAGSLVFAGAKWLQDPRLKDGKWQLAVGGPDGERRITTRYLVDASGRSSWFARRMGIPRTSLDTLVGVVGFWLGSRRQECRLLVEAFEDGWWYSGRLPGGGAVAACMIDEVNLPREPSLLLDFWKRTMQKASLTCEAWRQDGDPADLRCVSANSSRIARFAGEAWLALGDAAIAYDPLSGRGIRQALAGAIRAVAVVLDFMQHNHDSSAVYCEWLETEFRSYCQMRRRHYASVNRWPEAPFWRNRARLAP